MRGCADQRRDFGDVLDSLRRQRKPRCKIAFVSRGSGMVSREKAVFPEAIEHLAELGGAGQDVVARQVGIVAKIVLGAQFIPSPRHDLHEATRTLG